MIDGSVIEAYIREGAIHRAPDRERYRLIAEVNGVEWWLIVAIHADEQVRNDVLTAYAPTFHDADEVEIAIAGVEPRGGDR